MYNRAFEELYIKEQAAERMSKCLDAGSTCIRKITTYKAKDTQVQTQATEDKEYREEDYIPTTTLHFSQCESCGCLAPHLFYARVKNCKNKDGSIKWGPMMSEEDWEKYKIKHKLYNHAEYNSESGLTDSEPESTSSIQLTDRGGDTDDRNVSAIS
jgi:hypothetical protein